MNLDKSDAERYRDNLRGELDGAQLYRMLAEAEHDNERASLFRELSEAEERHAAMWRQRLVDGGADTGEERYRPSLRVRVLGWLARRLGTRAVLPIVDTLEAKDYGSYVAQPEAGALAKDERIHGRVVRNLSGVRGLESPAEIVGRESWHRFGSSAAGGTLRATIFGLSDGLLANFSLVMGVAGGQADRQVIVLAGFAGLLAGAFSMGAGEYVSMRSQREMFERQIELEREELEATPEEEREELVLIYRAKGVPEADARQLADRIIGDRSVALDTLVREELGLNPEELGSPWGAAIGSFLAFAFGAILPVIPYLFSASYWALAVSACLAGTAAFGLGSAISLLTGRSFIYSGLRSVVIGGVAAVITFFIGRLIGVSTGV